jgi:hypothetical protein
VAEFYELSLTVSAETRLPGDGREPCIDTCDTHLESVGLVSPLARRIVE